MTAHLLGNLLGRLLMSAALVYLVVLAINRFDFKRALSRLKRPLPIVSIVVVFFLGLAGSLRAEDGRALRPFLVTKVPEAGLQIYVPERPEWHLDLERRAGNRVVLLSTPADYYPRASMEIVLNKRLRIDADQLRSAAVAALNTARENAGIRQRIDANSIKAVSYGVIQAYEDQYELTVDDESYSVKSVMGIMPSGRPITLLLATAEGQLTHIKDMSEKIWSKLKELPAERTP